jgi:hypothetical protein
MRIGEYLLVGLFFLLLILLLPIILPYLLFLHIRTKIEERGFRKYLRTNEGAKFFCYTSRQTSEKYVRENVLPLLPPHTRIVYLRDSRKPFNLGDDLPFLQYFVGHIKRTPGSYPYAARIVKGQLVSISINQQLYSAITRKADADAINKKIARFLDGAAAKETSR